MDNVVDYQVQDRIATVTIQNGKANALSHEVFQGLNDALDRAEQENAIVILTGQPGIFSAGYDLKEMGKSAEAASALVKAGSTFARRLASSRTPVICACPGHAIAKGAFLLLSSDYRIGVSGDFKLGLNEVAIGMTMHHAGIEIARRRLAPAFFQRSVVNAEIVTPQTAVTAGYLDELTEPEALLETARQRASQMLELDLNAHYQTKVKANAEYLELLDRCIEKDAQNLGLK